MVNFLKSFGKGLLYLLVLPVIIVGVAIYGVVGIFIFIYLAFKGLVLFFCGKSLFDDLPEDIEAKRRLHPEEKKEAAPVKTTPNLSFDTPVMQDNNGEPVSEPTGDPFYVPEYLKPEESNSDLEQPTQEEQREEIKPVDQPVEEVVSTFEAEIKQEEPEEEIIAQEEVILDKKPNQNTTILEISEIEDDEPVDDDSSGINIEFH